MKNNSRSALLVSFFSSCYLLLVNARVFESLGSYKLGIDDSHIFFTYAENLRDGLGFRYSAGIPRTEGFSSPLWMLVSVISFLLRLDEYGVLVATLLLQFLSLLIIWKILKESLNSLDAIFVFIGCLISLYLLPSFWVWNGASLMENTLLLFWQLITALVIVRRLNSKKIHAFFFFTAWLRLEAIVLTLGQILVFSILNRNRENLKKCFRFTLNVFAGLICVTLVRFLVFGEYLPNTYYAKVSPNLEYRLHIGAEYVQEYFSKQLITSSSNNFVIGIALALILRLFLIFGKKDLTTKALLSNQQKEEMRKLLETQRENLSCVIISSLVVCASSLLMAWLKGGDHFKGYRLFSTSNAFESLLFLVLGFSFGKKVVTFFTPKVAMKSYGLFPKSILVLLIWLLFFTPALGRPIFSQWNFMKKQGINVINDEFQIASEASTYSILEKIRKNNSRNFSIGIITGGVAGRNFKGKIYDLTGLNYGPIAHNGGERIGFYGHSALERKDFSLLKISFIPDKNPGGIDFFLRGLTRETIFYNKYKFGELCHTKSECVTGYLENSWTNLPFRIESTFDPDTLTWSVAPGFSPPTQSFENGKCNQLANLLIGVLTGRSLFLAEPLAVTGVLELTNFELKEDTDKLIESNEVCSGYVTFQSQSPVGILFYQNEGQIIFRTQGGVWRT